jgi:hypothetical protein
VDVFKLFFYKELADTTAEESNRHTEQFLCGHTLSSKSTARAWEPMTEGEIYVVLELFMLVGIIQRPILILYFTTKTIISTPGFEDITTKDRIKLICKFLHFANNETIKSFQRPKKLFKIFPVISYLSNKF